MRKNFKYLIFFITFVFLSVLFIYTKSNPTVIIETTSDSVLKQKTFNQLLKGQKITGEFKTDQNYLGQVLIRFYNYDRINKDSVIFRLKENGGNSWYYEHSYKTDQFQPNKYFTFGFPIIIDSKNKNYYFEIESVNGVDEDAVTLSETKPLIALIYQYPKTQLIKNPSLLKLFSINKLKSIKIDEDFIINSITYIDFISLIILVEYLLLENIFKKGIKAFQKISTDILVLGLIILFFSAIPLYLKKTTISSSFTLIAFFLIVIGIIKILLEERLKK